MRDRLFILFQTLHTLEALWVDVRIDAENGFLFFLVLESERTITCRDDLSLGPNIFDQFCKVLIKVCLQNLFLHFEFFRHPPFLLLNFLDNLFTVLVQVVMSLVCDTVDLLETIIEHRILHHRLQGLLGALLNFLLLEVLQFKLSQLDSLAHERIVFLQRKGEAA